METAMQELIKTLKAENVFKGGISEIIIVDIMDTHIKREKQQIIEAYKDGCNLCSIQTSEDYYKENFNQ